LVDRFANRGIVSFIMILLAWFRYNLLYISRISSARVKHHVASK